MKYLSIIRYVFLAISVLTVLLFFVGVSDVDLMLNWAYILLGLTIAVSILFPAANLAKNPQGAIRSLVGLAIVVVVLGISYAMASDAVIVTPVNTFDDPMALKLSDMGLFATYIALGVAILASIIGEVSNIFK